VKNAEESAETSSKVPLATAKALEAPRSLALTGSVDEQGRWALDRASASERPLRQSVRGEYTLKLLYENARVLHSETLRTYASSESDGAAWMARVPVPSEPVRWIIVRDDKSVLLDEPFPGDDGQHSSLRQPSEAEAAIRRP